MAGTNPPTNTTEEQEVLVRGSAAYKEYMRNQAGWLKAVVNGLEDYLAIAGRSLLLLFLIYTTVKAGMGMMGVTAPVWLEVLMLSLQVAGVEGAVPGLSRHRESLLNQPGKEQDARTISRAIMSTRTLAVLTGIEIVLYMTPSITLGSHVIPLAGVNDAYSKALLIARLIVISSFLIAMARIEHKGPKIISQEEYDRQQRAEEQEQIRMENNTIQAAIQQAMETWTQAQESRLTTWLEQQKEAVAASLSISQSALSKATAPLFEAFLRQNAATVKQENEAHMRQTIEAARQEQDGQVRQAIEALTTTVRQQQEDAIKQLKAASKEAPRTAGQPASVRPAKVVNLGEANTSRDALKAEAYRLTDEEGLSSYEIEQRIGKPAKTIQRWLRERNTGIAEDTAGTEDQSLL